MNPAQYKQAMRQRALERRAELNREEAASPSEGSLGVPHPPGTDTSAELKLQGNDVDDGSAATSPATCSSTGGCGLDEGFCIQNEVRRKGSAGSDKLSFVHIFRRLFLFFTIISHASRYLSYQADHLDSCCMIRTQLLRPFTFCALL